MTFYPTGICPSKIEIEVESDTIKSVHFIGGCNGNLQGISKLVEGMNVDDAIVKMKGIKCGFKSTSCPDQLAIALQELKAEG